MLSDLVRGNEAIFWLILRPDGSVYSASDTSFWAKPVGESVPQLSGSVGAQRQQIIGLPGDAEVLVEPLKLKEKGVPYVFCLAFSTAEIRQLQSRMIWQTVSITSGLIGLLGLLFYLYLYQVLTKPLGRMMHFTAAIASGDWRQRISLTRSDELGQLARSFDKMAGDLQTTTVSKQYVDNVIHSIGDPLILLDSQGVIESVNPAAIEMLGYSLEELIGQPIQLVGAADAIRSLLAQPGGRGQIDNVETVYLARDGRRISVLLSASVVTTATAEWIRDFQAKNGC